IGSGPYMWEHYNVTLILPLTVACVAIWRARRLGLSAWATLGAVAAGLAIVRMLAVQMEVKIALRDQIRTNPSVHLQLHLHELYNWLPWVLLLALLCWLWRS